jgi:2-methylcitrate dehydratase PrpD
MDPSAAATRFTEGLRRLYRIRNRVDANATHAAYASMDALRAAQHKLAGPSGPQAALMLESFA